MKIEFIKNPTGPFGLSYGPGDVVEFEDEFATKLIESGVAIQAKQTANIETADDDQTGKQTADLKRGKR